MSNNIVEDFFEQFEKVSGRAVFWYNIRITTDQYFNINFFIVSGYSPRLTYTHQSLGS
jgi:tRNA G10  N-methylase Trm11